MLLLVACWWPLAAMTQISNFVAEEMRTATLLLVLAGSIALWSLPVKRLRWPSLGILSLGLIPVGLVILLAAWRYDYHSAAYLGWLAWTVLITTRLWFVKRLDEILPQRL
ncbi:MAG: hypothetical protein KZQ63_16900 [Candidatus Thiodiazotropha sp. (ex Lucinoma aequizonata)]|nr:hypothetical protein [Candidatus Thiodiazotropha sp. (ex Lucinoma aequizonata)]